MDLAAAHDTVVHALEAQTDVPVFTVLDPATPKTGPCYVVGAPSATGLIKGGYCYEHEYEVPVVVMPAGANLPDLLLLTGQAMDLLAEANLNVLSATPGTTPISPDASADTYLLTVTP